MSFVLCHLDAVGDVSIGKFSPVTCADQQKMVWQEVKQQRILLRFDTVELNTLLIIDVDVLLLGNSEHQVIV